MRDAIGGQAADQTEADAVEAEVESIGIDDHGPLESGTTIDDQSSSSPASPVSGSEESWSRLSQSSTLDEVSPCLSKRRRMASHRKI